MCPIIRAKSCYSHCHGSVIDPHKLRILSFRNSATARRPTCAPEGMRLACPSPLLDCHIVTFLHSTAVDMENMELWDCRSGLTATKIIKLSKYRFSCKKRPSLGTWQVRVHLTLGVTWGSLHNSLAKIIQNLVDCKFLTVIFTIIFALNQILDNYNGY